MGYVVTKYDPNRLAAIERGEKQFVGAACRKNPKHALRYVSDGKCVECKAIVDRARVEARRAARPPKPVKPVKVKVKPIKPVKVVMDIARFVGFVPRVRKSRARLPMIGSDLDVEDTNEKLVKTNEIFLRLLISEKLSAIRNGVVPNDQVF